MRTFNQSTSRKTVSFWLIFWVIFKISIISFGGGNAIFPIIKNQMVDKYHWITVEELDDIIVVTNSIPGASVVESLSYISIIMLKSKWKGLLVTFFALMPHILIFFLIFMLGISFFPTAYLDVIYIAVIPIIVIMLMGLTIRYFRSFQRELNYPIFMIFFIISVAFCFLVPTPYNIPIILVGAVIIFGICYEVWKKYWFKKHPPALITLPTFKKPEWARSPAYKTLMQQTHKKTISAAWLVSMLNDINPDDINVKYKIICMNDTLYFRPKWGYQFTELKHD